jgi:hypothetical protein
MNESEWEEVKEGSFWSPKKEGEYIEGVIISMENEQFGLKVTLEQPDKKTIVLPSHAVLQSRIKNCKPGDIVKVVFERTELPKIKGHNPTNIYKVLKKIGKQA